VSLLIVFAVAITAFALWLAWNRVRMTRRDDLGSISERWLSEQRTGRDRSS